MIFKYAVIGAAVIVGMMLFLRSRSAYFSLGWLVVVLLPLVAISVAEQPIGLFRQQPRHEQIFIYVWIFAALIELFLFWIPAMAYAFRSSRGIPGSPPETDSHAIERKRVDGV